MFTLKFMRVTSEGVVTTTVACPCYQVFERDSGITSIIIHKTFIQNDGVEYHITDRDDRGYHNCYIENQAGKTIAHYSIRGKS